jgi:DNA-binding transcriptional LysR family regulator
MISPFSGTKVSFKPNPMDDPRLLSGDYWGELRVFLAVAKTKSFNRAAEVLHISQPTVARNVRRLQDMLGCQLVTLTKNGINLTANGQHLAATLLGLDHTIHTIFNELHLEKNENAGTVSIAISEGLGGVFLAPSLAKFSSLYPKIVIQIKTPRDLNGLRANQTDLMIAFAPVEAADIVCTKMGVLHLIPVASRLYVEKMGVPTSANLAGHSFVNSDVYSSNNNIWHEWQSLVKKGTISHECDSPFAYASMVRSGLGIGLLANYTTSDPEFINLKLNMRVPLQLYSVALKDRMQSHPVRLVNNWVCSLFNLQNPWFSEQMNQTNLPQTPLIDMMKKIVF